MQRFHGAFTGGFNAGHNNTVGSEEGFNPSTFVSSRGNRATHKVQSASNFVDSEDGLLGGILSAKNVRLSTDMSNLIFKQHNTLNDDYHDEYAKDPIYKSLRSKLQSH
jgi:hypothetical protein